MNCPNCQYDCPAEFTFCPSCGTRLRQTCTECGFEVRADFQFCPRCGTSLVADALETPAEETDATTMRLRRLAPRGYAERLLATRGRMGHERRLVTILFSDVKGSTAIAAGLDPEEVLDVMQGALEMLIEPIYRYEGTVARLMGDAILAFFGAPIAHEDDPERAIRAALDIVAGAAGYRARLERDRGISGFNVRVGVNTGLVVVGEVGSDLRVEYTAMGDAINVASRMEGAAEPGTVLITEATHRLIAPMFETELVGPIRLKGQADAIEAYRVLGAKAVTGKIRGIAGLGSPLVGREAEFGALQEALARLRVGVGGIVTLVGDAGVGKSRLVAEARRSVVGAPSTAPMRWIEGRCLSYGTSVPYLLWLDVLRGLLGVTAEATPRAVGQILGNRVQALCAERQKGVYPYLARLLSVPVETEDESALRGQEAERLKANTFAAVEALLRCTADERPMVLVCEDIHWADPTSVDLLERVLALTDQVPLLLICVSRPQTDVGAWRIRESVARLYRHRHTDLWLTRLSLTDSQVLLGNLMRLPGLPDSFQALVLEHAEGNPFYVEEIVRSLINSGAIVRDTASGGARATGDLLDVVIPDTLQGVLMARIDRLQEDTKRILQMAAVVGRIFLYRVLSAIAAEERQLDEHLLTLQREEMVRERARIPELEYIFKHELLREAAYNGLLNRERRSFHRQVAEAIEQLFADRIDEQVDLLAYHWERAGISDRAVDYLIRAGDRGREDYACAEAIEHYSRALELVGDVQAPGRDDLEASILDRRGDAYAAIADMGAARQDLYRALARSRQAGDQRREAEILLGLIQPLLVGHQLDEAMACAREAHGLAISLQDQVLILRCTGALGSTLCVKGELSAARGYLQDSLVAGREHGAADLLWETLFHSMIERNWVADFRGALELADEALVIARRIGAPVFTHGALFVSAIAQCGLGEYENALDTLAEADRLDRQAQMPNAPAELLNVEGWVHQEIYNLEESRRLNERGVAVARRLGETESEANALVNLGVDHLWMGSLPEAERRFQEAWNLLDRQFGGFRWRWKTRLLAAWGELWLAQGDARRALALADECLEVAERTSARKNLAKGWKLKGEALAALGNADEATSCLATAVGLAEEIGNPPLIWKSHHALARALAQQGHSSRAQMHADLAVAVVENTAASLRDVRLRETFLSAAAVRAVLSGKP